MADGEEESRHLRVLPILNWKTHSSSSLAPWRLTVFPLIYAGRTGPDPSQRYLIVFPLWWKARDTRVFFPIFWSSPKGFTALFPLWGHFDDLWGRDSVTFVLFPLWARSHRERGAVTDTLLWPLFAWTRGGPFHGLRAWPLFGWSREEEKWLRGFVLWPLGHFRRGTLPDGRPDNLTFFFPYRFKWEIGDTVLNARWPLWATYRTPGHDTWSVAWPLFMHRVNRRHSFVEDRLLWIVGRWQRGETHRALELLPIAGRRERPGRRLRYILFPICTHFERWSTGDEESGEEARGRDVKLFLPLHIRSRSWRDTPSGQEWKATTWTLPLFLRRENSDGRSQTHWLWPLFITRSDGYERSWGMFFKVWEQGRTEDGSRWSRLMWHLWRREVSPAGAVRSEYNGLLIRRLSEGDVTRLSILGPFLRRTSDLDGVRWSWFNSGPGA